MKILQTGSEGIEVANWQRFLIAQGYHIDADGDFGPATDIATKHFQAAQGLRADGKVGDATTAAAYSLKPAVGSQQTAVSTNTNEAVLSAVHPALAHRVRKILVAAQANGYELRIVQGLRTFAEQNALYAQRPKVTNAKGGQSMHNYGLACDLAFVVDGKISWNDSLYSKIGKWAASAGLEWGGTWRTFKDLPHVQLPNLPSYKVLLPIYQKGGLTAVWSRFN